MTKTLTYITHTHNRMPRATRNINDTVLGILTRDTSSKRRLIDQQQQQQPQSPVSSPTNTTHPSSPQPHPHKNKFSFLYALLNPRSRQWQAVLFKRVISWVIVIDLLSFILSTEPALKAHHDLFHQLEGVSSSVFLLEYLARLLVCTEKPKYRDQGPVTGRLSYMVSPAALMDAVATIPFFVDPLLRYDLPRLTYLRVFRLLRLTKTHGAVRATDAVYRVIYYNREILYVASVTCTLLVLGTGVGLYYLRPLDANPDQRGDSAEQFESILSTMYLSTMMLTGQGMYVCTCFIQKEKKGRYVIGWNTGSFLEAKYRCVPVVLSSHSFHSVSLVIFDCYYYYCIGGPEGELPWYTKAVVLLTSLVSVAMFAIPASMLTWGFEAEAARMAKRAYSKSKREREGLDSSDDEYSTDEEYQKIIAGEADDDGSTSGGDNDDPWRKELMERFARADEDGSGHISLQKFIAVSNSGQPTTSGSASTPVGEGPGLAMVMSRLIGLEQEQKANSAKLDQILQLLESKKVR